MAFQPPTGLQRTVIDAAVGIVASTGPDDLSLRSVARAAGVSHQAPYHYFKDREGLFAAICEEGFHGLAVAMESAQSTSPESMFQSYVKFALDNPGHFRVMFRHDICDLERFPNALVQADRAFGVLVDFVTRHLAADVAIDQIRVTATYMWSTAHGLATLLLDGPLEKKVGAIANRDDFIASIARVATRALR